MNRCKLIFLFVFVSVFSFKVNAEEMMSSKGPYFVAVYYEFQAETSWTLRVTALNEYGQVAMIRGTRMVEGRQVESISQTGERFCGNILTLVKFGKDKLTFELQKTTSGSALVVFGEGGAVIKVDTLPNGVTPEIDQATLKRKGEGFVGFFRVADVSKLPLTPDIFENWRKYSYVANLCSESELNTQSP